MTEHMDIVNEQNQVVGQTTQEEIYAKKLNHRIVHVLVINPKTNKVYFQKRSETKSFLPGYYCTSAGGHVRAGETYEDAGKRELREELGLDVPIRKACSMTFVSDMHKRFITLFVAFAEGGFDFTDGEVSGGEFLDFDAAYDLVQRDEKIHPQLRTCFNWFYEHKEGVLRK